MLVLPNFLGIKHPDAWLPLYYEQLITQITGIICESYKSADLLISRTALKDDVDLLEINEHTNWKTGKGEILSFFKKHQIMAVLSDAGMPGIADPGAEVIALAHQQEIEVQILPGANSMILALAASGFNGQKFAFQGYLPIEQGQRKITIDKMIKRVAIEHESQIFMETPYRNTALFNELINLADTSLGLCLASNLLDKDEWIKSMSIKDWKVFAKTHSMDEYIKKKPTVFVLGRLKL